MDFNGISRQQTRTDKQGKQRDKNKNKLQTGAVIFKKIVTKIKRAFDELISRLGTAEERISEFENMSVDTPKS